VHGLDVALLAATVTQGAPHGSKPLCEGILTDALMGPELIHKFVFGGDAIAMLHEVDEHVEALALEGTGGVAVAEFIALRIELVIAESIDHTIVPLSLHTVQSLTAAL
jgi:hypothetical protein